MSAVLFWSGLAVLIFWAIGAYNRLVRLRARVGRAFAPLDERLVRQLVWVQGCLPPEWRAEGAVPEATEGEPVRAAWRRLLAASEQLSHSLAAARARPLDAHAVAALTEARSALNMSWQRVSALGVGLTGARLPAEWLAQHEQLLAQILPLCEAFNQAAWAYNEAIAQFPALLLARLFGFRPAGVMQPMALVA